MRFRPLARLSSALLATALAGGAAAATLNEATATGGAFSGRWDSPTEIAAGIDTIAGTGGQNAYDNFVFTGLPSGAQTLTLTFSAPAGIGYSYSAGGSLLYADKPFRWGWDGSTAGTVQIDYYTRSRSYEIALGDGFSGKLYLALNFTHGSDLAYTIGVPSNAMPVTASPVPLPAGAVLMGSAVAALGAAGLFRRRRVTATT